ncbi:MAG: hypothetical protein ACE5GL_11650 [Calditrichia bacterium]
MNHSIQNKFTGKKFALWVENLMSRTRLMGLCSQIRITAETVSSFDEAFLFLKNNPEGIMIIDLENRQIDFEQLKSGINEEEQMGNRIIGFFPHVEIGLKNRAKEAGIGHIVPRSVVFGDLSGSLERVIKG